MKSSGGVSHKQKIFRVWYCRSGPFQKGVLTEFVQPDGGLRPPGASVLFTGTKRQPAGICF